MESEYFTKDFSVVINEISKTIDIVGEEAFIKKIQQMREQKSLQFHSQDCRNVISTTSDIFNISEQELIYGKKRPSEKTHALGVIAYILTEHKNYKLKEVSLILNKHITNLSRWKNEVINYDENHPLDKERIEKLSEIEHKLLMKNFKNGKK